MNLSTKSRQVQFGAVFLFPRQYFPLFNIITKKRKYIYSFLKNAIINKGDDKCGNIL